MRLRERIEAIMRDGGGSSASGLAAGLQLVALFYGWGLKLRDSAYARGVFRKKELPCMVIAVGNLTLGGTGKTPMTVYLARLIGRLGYKVVVLSRGYGGAAEDSGGIVCDGRDVLMQPEESGDEPFMIAKHLATVPVLVGRKRYCSGMLAFRRFRPDVVLLDDAFQHRQLARDLDIVLLDARNPLGNGYLFPRGTLRERAASLKRCDAVVFTRAGRDGPETTAAMRSLLAQKSVFRSSHRPYIFRILSGSRAATRSAGEEELAALAGKRIFAFSGIARNDDFHRMLKDLGCIVTGVAAYADHYAYSRKDFQSVADAAVRSRATCLVTTEKDYFRAGREFRFPLDLVVMGVEIQFQDDAFDGFVRNRLARSLDREGRGHESEAK